MAVGNDAEAVGVGESGRQVEGVRIRDTDDHSVAEGVRSSHH